MRLAYNMSAQGEEASVVVVDIDSEAMKRYGDWPWDRTLTAELLSAVERRTPSVIGVGIVFPERSRPESDQQLVRAINQASKVVLGYVGAGSREAGWLVQETRARWGFLELELGDDGRVLGVRQREGKEGMERAFAVVVAGVIEPERAEDAVRSQGVLRPNFLAARRIIRHVSAARILSNQTAEGFHGKAVVISSDIGPIRPLTTIGRIRTSDLYAILIQNTLDRSWLRFARGLNVFLCIVMAVAVSILRPQWLVIAVASMVYLLTSYGFWMPRGVVTSTVSVVSTMILAVGTTWGIVGRS